MTTATAQLPPHTPPPYGGTLDEEPAEGVIICVECLDLTHCGGDPDFDFIVTNSAAECEADDHDDADDDIYNERTAWGRSNGRGW